MDQEDTPASSKKRAFSEYAEDAEQSEIHNALPNPQEQNLEPGNNSGMTKSQRRKRAVRARKAAAALENGDDQPESKKPRVDAVHDTRPALQFVPHKLNSKVHLNHFRELVLYCIADGIAPSWISVRNHQHIRKVVVLLVPGLEQAMFEGSIPLQDDPQETEPLPDPLQERRDGSVPGNESLAYGDDAVEDKKPRNPDDYVPLPLVPDDLPHALRPIADVFPLMWPLKSPGDDKLSQVHSPLHAMLTVPISGRPEEKQKKKVKSKAPRQVKVGEDWEDERTTISAFIASKEELLDNGFVLHSLLFEDANERQQYFESRRTGKDSVDDGWKETPVKTFNEGASSIEEPSGTDNSILAGRKAYALDCEMCVVGDNEYALTRISIVSWDGELVMDELVKPDKPIVNYVTQYSGITEAMLAPVTTRLADIQDRVLSLLTPDAVLIGHSLDSDLAALKLSHPSVVDTSIIYPHPRGPPAKSSLKFLTQRYLNREIQQGHGSKGHNSIEDAKACLDLVRQKCEKGKLWGTSDSTSESVFKRLDRSGKPKNDSRPGGHKSGAIVDHGSPERSFGQMATYSIGCKDDEGVVQAVKRCVLGDVDGEYIPGGGVELTWARLRELDIVRGWANNNRHVSGIESIAEPTKRELRTAVLNVSNHIKEIRSFLPPCTLFVAYSGTGDPRKLAKLQELHRTFKKEYNTKKWDQLSVKWTDKEQQEMNVACKVARASIGFACMT